MSSSSPERPRTVTIVGWAWLVVASLRCLNGLLGLVVWKVGGLDRGLPFLPLPAGRYQIQTLGFDAMMRHTTEILVLQTLAGGAIAFVAFELLRRKSWARTALEAASWLGIALAAGMGVYVYAATVAMAAETPESAATIRVAGAGAGVLIALLGAAFFGATIAILRRPDARRYFEPASAVEPS